MAYTTFGIPNRFEEGYGLNIEALQNLAEEGVRVVVTVDCGIRSLMEAEFARSIGLKMVISDHHHPQESVPSADAVICQKRIGSKYPDQNLAGVGLAYKLAEALLQAQPVPGKAAEDWLDLVALGTVADIVPLLGENRGLVRAGLNLLRQGKRVGIRALANASGVAIEKMNAGDIGYSLGPRLNAAGRLESALKSYDLLMTDDLMQAGLLAQQLCDQNSERQEMTKNMQKIAEEALAKEEDGQLIFTVSPEFTFNQVGLVGLVAARLTETYYRPSIVGVANEGEGYVRCSCRSIPEFHITHALDECADLMVRHGGHAMAAGLTVKAENLPELKRRLYEIAQRELSSRELNPTAQVDLVLPLSELKLEVYQQAAELQPTGAENPEAVFVSRNLMVRSARTFGKEQNHLKLVVSDGRVTYDAVAFRQGRWSTRMPEHVDLLYTFEINSYNGRETFQLNVRDIRESRGR